MNMMGYLVQRRGKFKTAQDTNEANLTRVVFEMHLFR